MWWMLWREPEVAIGAMPYKPLGSLRDSRQGFLLMTLRTRSLRTEFLESLLLDKAVVLNKNIILLLSRRSLLAHRFGALASRRLVRRS